MMPLWKQAQKWYEDGFELGENLLARNLFFSISKIWEPSFRKDIFNYSEGYIMIWNSIHEIYRYNWIMIDLLLSISEKYDCKNHIY